MNRKGFTLVELLATLVILGIVVSISIYSMNGGFNNAKSKSEDVFIGTIKDAMEIYLSSDAKDLEFGTDTKCDNTLVKSFGSREVYKVETTFDKVINSKYKPITEDDLVNPANKDVECADGVDIVISIYRDEDFVYYYSIDKDEFTKSGSASCLLNDETTVISNLPEGYECD